MDEEGKNPNIYPASLMGFAEARILNNTEILMFKTICWRN